MLLHHDPSKHNINHIKKKSHYCCYIIKGSSEDFQFESCDLQMMFLIMLCMVSAFHTVFTQVLYHFEVLVFYLFYIVTLEIPCFITQYNIVQHIYANADMSNLRLPGQLQPTYCLINLIHQRRGNTPKLLSGPVLHIFFCMQVQTALKNKHLLHL